MNYKEITELIKLINRTDLAEFKMKDKDFEIQIRTKKYHKEESYQAPMVAPISAPVIAPTPTIIEAPKTAAKVETSEAPAAKSSANLLEIKSPIVGTFYRASGPDKPPFVKVGDEVSKGSAVCIIEAMKLFNEIESEVSGKIVKIMVEDATPVEYDQVLFLVEP
ncbi:MAG TPA: acetyl-CoA carboxylase biotin carboxyl carrier protein [Saprospiraceae bacterium]|nr:acetyl-CoA carboxylase biotin carboxyl carrier protein [Saprospiraceae bacterium]MCB9327280.1 acetyl-CoA carboxylase biotin carboxyl carrier protein [Lewinellaceae bacterium]HPK09199.1 acetyl-CoA carboxylase biotin carboxyl carrier protein [Saprospiraceae bacterium]HPQ20622.1 acetyl-CoA carboxylase biotin carboxyl carrier protein [Saprospiraceae bacterium]HRX28948.1 acetyl-CoA carboxylase biotin carboxyl carrier protein [Saprospiraceae bacterium]